MKIAIIGGGASGMATAYLLDKEGHKVTVFERQPILGGHIRTLNKNLKPNQADCDEVLESGVLEFPTAFHSFMTLMEELEVDLEPVRTGSGMFRKDGNHFLSGVAIDKNFSGFHALIEHLRLDTIYARSAGVWLKVRFAKTRDFHDQPLSAYLRRPCSRNTWLKLMVMYSYSMPFELIDDFPAELAIPMLLDYISVDWIRVKGGVYTYIEKILARFKGEILLNAEIAHISRSLDAVKVVRTTGEMQEFDKVVFATPPDQVMALLADPSEAEAKRFSAWKANYITSIVHRDSSMYAPHDVKTPSEFDFFQTKNGWGYNGYLNQLCAISSSYQHHFLSFQLEELIAKDRIIHTQEHHTPFYTTESFRYRNEVIETNGENNTYHAGAYLGDGLHGGAIDSAYRVAQLITADCETMLDS
ncbi:FAD-dependent oxidoreductase [Synechocystis sp. FACHB-383]|uniref:FAD-dependent oxidoreductase n=1 Tax=Synechocystis sp. FACHB-383 TaxID=2692864 RepID=UPI0016821034|nr:FAD-dependent oxidoreductase [Synechocystis sp. FACHB-383]MBD2655476.1 FAD-dependent oxidoreductase [Synechocystis sp. FACHB-383]